MASEPVPAPDTIEPAAPPEVPATPTPVEAPPQQPNETPMVEPDTVQPGEIPAEMPPPNQ